MLLPFLVVLLVVALVQVAVVPTAVKEAQVTKETSVPLEVEQVQTLCPLRDQRTMDQV